MTSHGFWNHCWQLDSLFNRSQTVKISVLIITGLEWVESKWIPVIISWLLMSWQHKEPGHQLSWFWPFWILTWCRLLRVTLNSSPPGQNGRHFTDDIVKRIFLNENVRIPIWISLRFVPNGPIDNKRALIQVMVWRRTFDKPLPEPMLTQYTDAYRRHLGEMS